jgi:hypothetical protein
MLADATVAFEEELDLRVGSVLSVRAREQLGNTLAKLRAAGARIDPIGSAT